jgi:hypothetical protein
MLEIAENNGRVEVRENRCDVKAESLHAPTRRPITEPYSLASGCRLFRLLENMWGCHAARGLQGPQLSGRRRAKGAHSALEKLTQNGNIAIGPVSTPHLEPEASREFVQTVAGR